tara:strand:+ start:790 stop:2034 length:1245 start_codon:yes stop_codon:yes gene_type:complete
MNQIYKENIFFLLFLFLPISIVIGSSVSLVNLILINFFFLIVLLAQRKFDFINHKTIKLILILYLYLIFNSFISQNYEIGLARNIGFLRIVILFIFINYFFFYHKKKEEKLLNLWTLLLSIFIIDIFTEHFSGSNLLGWGDPDQEGSYGLRITSFFKDEPIAGAFLSGFIFLIFGHFLKSHNKNFYPIIFLIIAFTALIFTGERSNTIKIFLGIIIFFFLVDFIKIRTKIILSLLFIFVFGLILHQSEYLHTRYVGQLYNKINTKEKLKKFEEQNIYIKLYKSGYAVFKNYPIFGVGNKNYRIETCRNPSKQIQFNYQCLTHPHQVYVEFLSEHGVVGTIIILGILFFLMFKILRNILFSKDYIQIGTFVFVLINFTPLLPSGSFFGDFNTNIFWINFSIMFACNKKTNIFAKN